MPALLRWSVVALGLLLGMAGPLSAQTGTITGRVSDRQTGQALGQVRVEVVRGAGGVIATAFTTSEGLFRFPNLSPGSYTVAATNAIGYRDERIQDVVVEEGRATTITLQLPAAAFELAPVTVSVGRGQVEKVTEAPASVSVVSQLAIQERPALSLTEHLRNVQGVDVINSGLQSSNVVVRGFNNIFSGSLHMLTDYRVASLPSLRVNFLHFIPQTNEDMQRMEVVLGPASALYGPNTANGVLHMITKSPFDEQGTSLTVSGGMRSKNAIEQAPPPGFSAPSTGVLHLTGRTSHLITDNLGFKLSGQFLQGDDWYYIDPVEAAARAQIDNPQTRPIFIAAMPRNPDGSELSPAERDRRLEVVGRRDFSMQRYAGDARLDWRPSPEFSTIFSAGRSVSASGVELTGIGAGQADNWANSYVQGRVNWRRVFAQAYMNTSDAGQTYFLRTGLPVVDRSKLFATQLQHGLDVMEGRQSFTYGVDYIRTMPETEGTIHGRRENDDTMNEMGGYIQSTTRVTPRFDVVLAGRLDDHSHLPEVVFSPRAALVFKPAPDQSIRLTFNRAFSTPSSLNLFLDIDGGWAGDAIGPLGFRARAYGPGRDGIRFRDQDGNLFGMRSPRAATVQANANAATLLDANARSLYRLQLENFVVAAQLRGQPLPADLANFLRSLQAHPQLPQSIQALDPITAQRFSVNQIQDVPGSRESNTQSIEVGYKGVLADRLLLAADVWFDRRENFTSPLLVQSPLLLMQPETLVPFLVQQMTPVFMGLGLPLAQAQAQATSVAMSLAGVPGAVVGTPDTSAGGSDLIATYRNFGQVELWGVDLGATAILTNTLQFGVTASFVSDDHFQIPLDGVPQVIALNAPARKGTATLTYRNLNTGVNGEFRVRHNAAYPVNSAGYVGMRGCVDFDFGAAIINEPCVQAFNIVDLSAGYRLPMLRGASLQFSVQNLLNEEFRAFVGTPIIGRLAMVRMRYDF
jgi:outer membrane receptor for ferrienterochelin and colicins